MAIRLPTIAPTVQTPKVTLPGGPIVSGFMSQKPVSQMPTMQNLKPMPDYVAKDINLGWNYATGQVIPPLSAAQKAAVYIPPINLPPLVKSGPIIPTTGPVSQTPRPVTQTPKPVTPAAAPSPWLNYLNPNWSVPPKAAAPVKPAVSFPGQQNMIISQFLPKVQAPVRPAIR